LHCVEMDKLSNINKKDPQTSIKVLIEGDVKFHALLARGSLVKISLVFSSFNLNMIYTSPTDQS